MAHRLRQHHYTILGLLWREGPLPVELLRDMVGGWFGPNIGKAVLELEHDGLVILHHSDPDSTIFPPRTMVELNAERGRDAVQRAE